MDDQVSLWLVLALAYLFEFSNGWTDAPNSIATVVSTRVLRPLTAVVMAGVLNLLGALSGTAVAKTIASGIVDADFVTLNTIAAAVLAATVWALGAQYFGLPSSESHALVAGLLGAGFAAGGGPALEWEGTRKTLIGLVTSPVGGFFVALLLMVGIYWAFSKTRPAAVRRFFGKAQIGSAAFMAFSHGANDAQKTMGVITLALITNGNIGPEAETPFWVVVSAATAIALGTYMGGWRIIKTMGSRIIKMDTAQGFAAQGSGAAVILASTHVGFPLSTTHTISGAVIGSGAGKRLSAVRWGVAGNIVAAWILTLPAAAAIGGATYGVTRVFGTGAAGPVIVSVVILVAIGVAFARRVQQGSPITAAGG